MRRVKYGNRKIDTPDGKFDSQKEYRRWRELKLLEKAGKITNLERQTRFVLIPKVGPHREAAYVADFTYNDEEADGEFRCEDVKGFKTELYRLKRKMMRYLLKIEVIEV